MRSFMIWVLRWKTCLSSFPPSTLLNDKRPRNMTVIPSEAKDLTNLNEAFYVYMMTNQSRVVLYTGITNSLMRRVWQHQSGEIEGFSKSYKVNRLVYYKCFDDPRDAIAREK